MTLHFHKDGLQLDGAALRPYQSAEAVAFLRDLLDGYFPYELKHAFPEGVPFALVDRSDREQRDAHVRDGLLFATRQDCDGRAAARDWRGARNVPAKGGRGAMRASEGANGKIC